MPPTASAFSKAGKSQNSWQHGKTTAGQSRFGPKIWNRSTPENDRFFANFYVEIDKNSRTAVLKTWEEDPSDSKEFYRFEVAFGKVAGDKFLEGDNKTPEGIYFTRQHIKSGLPKKKYGPYAIPLDFPNPVDKFEGKTGYESGYMAPGMMKELKK